MINLLLEAHFAPVLLNMPDAAPPTLATVCGHEEDVYPQATGQPPNPTYVF